jgi:hypothetical protein
MKPQFFYSTKKEPRQPTDLELNEIFIKYELDKSWYDEHKFSWHTMYYTHVCLGYARYYQAIFNVFRNEKIKFLEIGCDDPRFPFGSAKAWLEYFPNGEIWGMDNFLKGTEEVLAEHMPLILDYTERGGNIVFGDQSDAGCLKEIFETLGKFNVILDDGSHKGEHIWTSLEEGWPNVESGGLYVIEDLSSCWPHPSDTYIHSRNDDVWATFYNLAHLQVYAPASLRAKEVLDKMLDGIFAIQMTCSRDYMNWLVLVTKK